MKMYQKMLSVKWWPFWPGGIWVTPMAAYVLTHHVASGPFYKHGLTLIPVWISNYIQYKVWDEITYPFPNFNGATVEV